jgi:tetratricopeptide (TPR) repeat protein
VPRAEPSSGHFDNAPPAIRAVLKAAAAALDRGDYADALVVARAGDAAHPEDSGMQLALAGVYIDAGAELRDSAAIDEGIRRLEAKALNLMAPADEYEAGLLYNLANGYGARQWLRRADTRSSFADQEMPAGESIALTLDKDTRKQKILYRRADVIGWSGGGETKLHIHVNFGNQLFRLNRFVEALDQYQSALGLEPDFAPALLNSAMVLSDVSHLVRRGIDGHWLDIRDRLLRALEQQKELSRIMGPKAVRVAHARLNHANAVLDANGGIVAVEERVDRAEAHVELDHEHPPAQVRDWAADGLLITLNARSSRTARYWIDDAFPEEIAAPLGTPTADAEAVVDGIVNRLNELKAEYATTRYLFTLADDPEGFAAVDAVTRYAHVSTPAQYDAPTMLRKVSYRVAADVLDKVAGVINELYGRWVPRERDVSMVTIWYGHRHRDSSLIPEARAAIERNAYVGALFDLSRDWVDADIAGHLRELRHALTHRYVPIYADPLSITHLDREAIPAPQIRTVRSPQDVRAVALFMLETARAAVLYAIGAVDLESRLRLGEHTDRSELAMWRPTPGR